MKKIILILFTVAIASVKGMAQEPPRKNAPLKTPEERAENMTKRMTKELSLTAEQQVKTKSIILKREQDRDKIMKEAKENREKMNEEFKAFLTSEQFQKLEQREVEMKKKREERRMKPPPTPKEAPQPPAPEGK